MKIIEQGIVDIVWGAASKHEILTKIEWAGRTCYKSEYKATKGSAVKFIKMILDRGHLSVLEHHSITVKVITDRGVSHEIVRHRLASYSQESTRYCSYKNREMEFIKPVDFELTNLDLVDLKEIEYRYSEHLEKGLLPQQARYFLPNGLKTEIVITMNLREWLHFFKMRTDVAAHPQMRDLAKKIQKEFKKFLPEVFRYAE